MKLKGKPVTLTSKILAIFIAIGGLILKIVTKNPIPMGDVIMVAAFVGLICCPIDMSLFVETFFSALGNYRMRRNEGDITNG